MFVRGKIWHAGLLCALLALAFSLIPEPALANNGGGVYQDADQRCEQIRNEIKGSDIDGVWFSEWIVECVKTVVTEAFQEFIVGFYDAVDESIMAALTLSIVLFGVGLAAGVIEKTSRDSFVLLFKLASVMYFVQVPTVNWIFESGLGAMEELTDIVFQFGKGSAEGRCIDNDTLWDRVDCMLDVIIGIKHEDFGTDGMTGGGGGEETGISRGLMYFFFSNMASSGIGAVIGFIGLYTIYSFLFALIKSIHTYLAAILGLAFILIFTPLFVPMIMFKQTRTYFDKWYRIAMSFVLQPVLLFGFLSLMMIAMENVLVFGDNSLLNTASGGQADQTPISRVYEDNNVYTKQCMDQFQDVSPPDEYASNFSGGTEGVMNRPVSNQLSSQRGATEIENLFRTSRCFDGIDYVRLAGLMNAGDEAEVQEQLVLSTITLALTCFVFLSMLNYIPTMATDLAGGVFEVPNLYDRVGSKLPGGDQAEAFARSASSNVRGQLSNMVSFRR